MGRGTAFTLSCSSSYCWYYFAKEQRGFQCAWTFHEHLFYSGPRGLGARAERTKQSGWVSFAILSPFLPFSISARFDRQHPGQGRVSTHSSIAQDRLLEKGARKLQRKSQLKSPELSIEHFCYIDLTGSAFFYVCRAVRSIRLKQIKPSGKQQRKKLGQVSCWGKSTRIRKGWGCASLLCPFLSLSFSFSLFSFLSYVKGRLKIYNGLSVSINAVNWVHFNSMLQILYKYQVTLSYVEKRTFFILIPLDLLWMPKMWPEKQPLNKKGTLIVQVTGDYS